MSWLSQDSLASVTQVARKGPCLVVVLVLLGPFYVAHGHDAVCNSFLFISDAICSNTSHRKVVASHRHHRHCVRISHLSRASRESTATPVMQLDPSCKRVHRFAPSVVRQKEEDRFAETVHATALDRKNPEATNWSWFGTRGIARCLFFHIRMT